MYQPFGYRFEDDNAFVRQMSGINMQAPDEGVEFGFESGSWTTQLALSNGAGGGAEVDRRQTDRGAHGIRAARAGAAGASAALQRHRLGDRIGAGLFGAFALGPGHLVRRGRLLRRRQHRCDGKLMASLAEADWKVLQGHNLKLTFEWLEPDDDVDEDEQTRTSVLYEWSPIQFIQLRGRRSRVRRHSAERQPEPQTGVRAAAWLLLDHWSDARTARMPASWSGSRVSSRRSCSGCFAELGAGAAAHGCSTSAAASAFATRLFADLLGNEAQVVGVDLSLPHLRAARGADASSCWCRPTPRNCAFATRPSISSGAATPSITSPIRWRALRHARGAAAGGTRGAGAERLPAGDVSSRGMRRWTTPCAAPATSTTASAMASKIEDTARIRGLVGLLQRAGLRVGRVHT